MGKEHSALACMREYKESIWHLSRIMKEKPCNRHLRPEAMDKEERLAAMKVAPLLFGWVGDRSAGLVLEPSVFESGYIHGRRNWTKLVMAAGARDGLKDYGLSSLRMDSSGEKTCIGRCWLAMVQNVDRLSVMLSIISSDSNVYYPCLCH